MKYCPKCGDLQFEDTITFCSTDGERLVQVDGRPSNDSQVPNWQTDGEANWFGRHRCLGLLVLGLILFFIMAGIGFYASFVEELSPVWSRIVNEGQPEVPPKNPGRELEFIWIPPGNFIMGSPLDEVGRKTDEGPQRIVNIEQGFWMGKYEITQGQFEALMGINPSHFNDCGADCPVEMVSWEQAKEFVDKLNQKEDGFLYSLPTEAEWEYAARSGTTTVFAFGDSLSSTEANFVGYNPYGDGERGPYLYTTVKVGSYQPNAWGLYDMHGNVWEWVEDVYGSDYRGLPNDGSANTTKGDLSARVFRGGGWAFDGHRCRSAARLRLLPSHGYSYGGFRVVRRVK